VREGPSGLCGFLRLAAHAAVVEDTAAWAEFADAGVVLSADVAWLWTWWSVRGCGGDGFGLSLGGG
jgi:hypothetical protein